MRVLITGGAGFIGSRLVTALLSRQNEVICVDNFDLFYSRTIKEENISLHLKSTLYKLIEEDILHSYKIFDEIAGEKIDTIIHFAAKAGVRPSIENPLAYQKVNVEGTLQMLELARKLKVEKFVFASSSSVYGVNPNVPWKESDLDLKPISPYASSKISAENFGKMYSHLFGINFIALRFFTVYGPCQRPDLAIHKFLKNILEKKSVPVYGDGSTSRDYTYVDDIVDGVLNVIDRPIKKSVFDVFNLGNSDTIKLSDLISQIENITGIKAIIERREEQVGDVARTFADISKAKGEIGYSPRTRIEKGLSKFYSWYKSNNIS